MPARGRSLGSEGEKGRVYIFKFFYNQSLNHKSQIHQSLTMNYLAHLVLSYHDEDLLLGNFVADFVKNKDMPQFSTGIQQGIMLHRKIDAFTDNHPEVKKATKKLRTVQRKYAPVVADVFYDYILYQNWEKYNEIAFLDFERKVYAILDDKKHLFSGNIAEITAKMVAGQWLRGYQSIAGIDYVFSRLKKRARFENNFEKAAKQLEAEYPSFEQTFYLFFPELQAYVKKMSG